VAKFHYWTRAVTGAGPDAGVPNTLLTGPSVHATRSLTDTLVRVRWHMHLVVVVRSDATVTPPAWWEQTSLTVGLWFNANGATSTPGPTSSPGDPGWVAWESYPWDMDLSDSTGQAYTVTYRDSNGVTESFGQRKGNGTAFPSVRGSYVLNDPTGTVGSLAPPTRAVLGWRSALAALWASDQPS
jgi:hypothetical protein